MARIEFEAETPIFIGAGRSGPLIDALIRTDWNGLPMIPGTALAGVLRHSITRNGDLLDYWNELFGYQRRSEGVGSRLRVSDALKRRSEGVGSRLRVSDALMILHDGKVMEDVYAEVPLEIQEMMKDLPKRHHVRITHRGAAEKTGLFDNQILPKGARFRCEIILAGNAEKDGDPWMELLSQLQSPQFRLGQGTRKGYGRLKVHDLSHRVFALRVPDDRKAFLEHNPSLNVKPQANRVVTKPAERRRVLTYRLALKPDSFFIFGAGKGDEKADHVPVTEWVFKYDTNGRIGKMEGRFLIPASSIKGAISHRVCFHHNRILGRYVDTPDNLAKRKEECEAVSWLFGSASDHSRQEAKGHAGRVIIDDMLRDDLASDAIFNHVTIDRFTGGAKRGFLFSERVNHFKSTDSSIELKVHVDMTRGGECPENYRVALELALKDICSGMLPLGGMTTKGHGVFKGELYRGDEKI